MRDLRVVCIGAGYFAGFHIEAWGRTEGARLVGVADVDRAKAGAHGVAGFGDAGEMLAAERPDIVDIITPPPTHLEMIRTAMQGKPRAIICQKPFCTSIPEAEEAAGLAARANIPLIVHENFRFQPWYRAAKVAMEAGKVGAVHQVTFRLRPGDGQGPRAYLDRQPYFQQMERFLVHETAVHWIDTFRFLLGNPTAVFADLRRLNPAVAGEDAGHILFAFGDGKRALFDGNRHLDHAAANPRTTMGEALIEGDAGTITLSGDGSLWLRRFGAEEAETLLPAQDWRGFGGDCVHALQTHVVTGLRSGTFENLAQDYLDVLRVEAAIYASAERRAWVDLD